MTGTEEMRGASRTSLAEARDRLSALASTTDLDRLAGELFGALDLLDREHALRRALADPAGDGQRKADLLRSVLTDQVGGDTVDLLAGVVRSKWANPGDLTDTVEVLAVLAEVIRAERAGHLDDVEDELFRFGRIVDSHVQLRATLSDPAASGERKAELVRELLAGKATDVGISLVSRIVAVPRGRNLDRGLAIYGKVAAQRRQRLIAVVTSAVPLTQGQKDRLVAALRTAYGHEVHLNIEVDPQVVGGLRVQVGDEVIDGSVAGRLEEVRRRLAG